MLPSQDELSWANGLTHLIGFKAKINLCTQTKRQLSASETSEGPPFTVIGIWHSDRLRIRNVHVTAELEICNFITSFIFFVVSSFLSFLLIAAAAGEKTFGSPEKLSNFA